MDEGRWITERLTLPDGRTVAVHERPGDGPTVVFCHPAPGAGRFDPDPHATRSAHVSLVAVDRPAYGGSDPIQAGRWATVASAADDVAHVLRTRGISEVGVAGWSAGGRVALALAARHPELVARVAVIGTPAPNEAVPWIPAHFVSAIEAMRDLGPDEVHAAFEEQMGETVPPDPAQPAALAQLGVSPDTDGATLRRPGLRDRLAGMLADAFRQGARGMALDVAGYTLQPWGFDPREVHVETLLLYGQADPVAGSRHANWWLTALPDAWVQVVPGAGHLVVAEAWDQAVSYLAAAPAVAA
ncbi:MAG TPA: alpha/beta hydrolase [Candidatus Limnocylindria bacterium]